MHAVEQDRDEGIVVFWESETPPGIRLAMSRPWSRSSSKLALRRTLWPAHCSPELRFHSKVVFHLAPLSYLFQKASVRCLTSREPGTLAVSQSAWAVVDTAFVALGPL